MSLWRHVVAIALLPGTVTVVVPAVILAGDGPAPGFGDSAAVQALTIAAGAILLAAGLALWAWTVVLFDRIGRGTLAPWDPTGNLVVAGPYRHVRNPMISGVLAALLGEGLALGSTGILIWAAVFLAINTIYFVASEEPGLEQRFGAEYRTYKSNVPRWLPRLTPWAQSANSSSVPNSPRSTSGGHS